MYPTNKYNKVYNLIQKSLWIENIKMQKNYKIPKFPKLKKNNLYYDVVIIGGGIFGCTTAYLLKSIGKKVALIEGSDIGNGCTGFSTAKLTSQHGPIYTLLNKIYDNKTAQLYYHMNENAIDLVKNIDQKLKLDCEFEYRTHTIWTSDEKKIDIIKKEYETCNNLGIYCKLLKKTDLTKELPYSIEPKIGITFFNQAQFNAYKYCIELCRYINSDGCKVYENSMVNDISNNSPHEIKLENDIIINSKFVVLATHIPILDKSLHFSLLEPTRSHCIAARLDNYNGKNKLHNMFINIDIPLRSLRTNDNDNIIVVAGETFKQGDETDTNKYYLNLEKWIKQHFNIKEIVTKWSAMDYFSSDILPYIGYLDNKSNSIFIATGFNKWGLTNGVAASQIVTDLIQNKKNPYYYMIDSCRINKKQINGLIQENLHTIKHFVGDKIKNSIILDDINSLKIDDGGIVKIGNKKVGVYLDKKNKYHIIEPICTHLYCDLVFNKGDKVWDCPCHGSRFDVDGKVLHGPACKPLNQIKI